MIKLFVDKNQLSKVDLQINTSGVYTKCEKCDNLIAVGNSEGFFKEVRTALENKLIYEGVEECGAAELNYCFECPVCFGKKIVPLELRLQTEKTLLIFDTKISEKNELLTKSSGIFRKQMPKNSANAEKIGDEKDKK